MTTIKSRPGRLARLASVLLVASAATACGSGAPGAGRGTPGSIRFTVSGEVLALGGYPFPPRTADDVAFVDGWEVKFAEVIATLDRVRLSENPDMVPTDQSRTGSVVAEADGPWAVDLRKGGPVAGKGGADERALPFAELTSQNRNGGAPFDPEVRYAVAYDLVRASPAARQLNLDAQGQADYEDMIGKGITVLYVGTATFRGSGCTPSGDPTLDALPRVVDFRFGFQSPTSYLNCQNPDNDPARAFDQEEHQRGIAVHANAPTVVQITVHTDHPFWESALHDSPTHFDQLAALAVSPAGVDAGVDAGAGPAGARGVVTMDDLAGVDFTAFRARSGRPLPWRSCVDPGRYPLPTTPWMGFDPHGVHTDPSAPSGTAFRDYRDFFTYNQSTQGHLNSDGLCFVKRNYPSPP
jgi:hypothetical protein